MKNPLLILLTIYFTLSLVVAKPNMKHRGKETDVPSPQLSSQECSDLLVAHDFTGYEKSDCCQAIVKKKNPWAKKTQQQRCGTAGGGMIECASWKVPKNKCVDSPTGFRASEQNLDQQVISTCLSCSTLLWGTTGNDSGSLLEYCFSTVDTEYVTGGKAPDLEEVRLQFLKDPKSVALAYTAAYDCPLSCGTGCGASDSALHYNSLGKTWKGLGSYYRARGDDIAAQDCDLRDADAAVFYANKNVQNSDHIEATVPDVGVDEAMVDYSSDSSSSSSSSSSPSPSLDNDDALEQGEVERVENPIPGTVTRGKALDFPNGDFENEDEDACLGECHCWEQVTHWQSDSGLVLVSSDCPAYGGLSGFGNYYIGLQENGADMSRSLSTPGGDIMVQFTVATRPGFAPARVQVTLGEKSYEVANLNPAFRLVELIFKNVPAGEVGLRFENTFDSTSTTHHLSGETAVLIDQVQVYSAVQELYKDQTISDSESDSDSDSDFQQDPLADLVQEQYDELNKLADQEEDRSNKWEELLPAEQAIHSELYPAPSEK